MKIRDLKRIIEKYPDNMDVYVHDSHIEDFRDIDVWVEELHKHKPSSLLRTINAQHQDFNRPVRTSTKGISTRWEYPNEFSRTFLHEHSIKQVLLIIPQRKRKSLTGS